MNDHVPSVSSFPTVSNCSRRQLLHGSAGLAGLVALAGPSAVRAESPGAGASPASGEPPLDSVAFRRAVEAGDLERVRWFLDRDGGLMYGRDEKGRSVFVLAYLAGHPEVGALLRERGLDLDLVEASIVPDWDRVNELAEVSPGLVNAYHPIGGTAMYAAARFGRGDRIWVLQSYGGDANANPLGAEGFTPLRAALECLDDEAAELTAYNLLANSGDPNAPQKDGSSVLHAAAARGNAYLARAIVRKGGDVDARDVNGKTPLDLAEANGHAEAAEALRNHRAIPRDCRTSRFAYDAGGGPCQMAETVGLERLASRTVGFSHTDLDEVRKLVARHPALAFGISAGDEMTVEAGAHMGRRDIVQFLLDQGVPLALPTSITMGDVKRARELLTEDPNRIHERGAHDFYLGWYPSIGGGSVEAAQLLMEFGLDVNGEAQRGVTPLHWTARAGQVELAAWWIEKGADVDARTRTGETALDFAAARGHGAVVELLRGRGARG